MFEAEWPITDADQEAHDNFCGIMLCGVCILPYMAVTLPPPPQIIWALALGHLLGQKAN